MKLSFKRITSSGTFIPEIDGLRFIAITSVIFYHLFMFFKKRDPNTYIDSDNYSFLKQLLSHGHLGVPLFFVISGFILALPFGKFYLKNEKRVNIKNFFLRRLTRLEPPYILTLIVCLFGAVFIAKDISLKDGLASFFSSLVYSHNIIYPGEPTYLNCVLWSLEIEIQFYILTPLIAYVFAIKSALQRRLVLISAMVIFLILNHIISLPFVSLINYFQYFLAGFLLADLYISDAKILPETKIDSLISLLLLLFIFIYAPYDFESHLTAAIWESAQLCFMFLLYYYILFHKALKVLSRRSITNIGGMCYSLYLLHSPIIVMSGISLFKYKISDSILVNLTFYSIILIIAIMAVSSMFYLLIERPCMDKNWYKTILKRPAILSKSIR